MTDIDTTTKKHFRQQARAQRRLAYSAAAADQLAAWGHLLYPVAGLVVAGYWPMGHEIDCRPLLVRLQGEGASLALPVVVAKDQPLEFRHWIPGTALESGPHGTDHPDDKAPRLVPDLVLVPLLAFDDQLGRLGYGGGYYDRTLQCLRAQGTVRAVGLAFAGQRMSAVPHDDYDQRLDAVLTESGLFKPEE